MKNFGGGENMLILIVLMASIMYTYINFNKFVCFKYVLFVVCQLYFYRAVFKKHYEICFMAAIGNFAIATQIVQLREMLCVNNLSSFQSWGLSPLWRTSFCKFPEHELPSWSIEESFVLNAASTSG